MEALILVIGLAVVAVELIEAVRMDADFRSTARRSRANLDAIATLQRRHRWTGWTLLDEPGISDVDGGRWQRAHVRCGACGEERDVWKGIPRDDRGFALNCPGRPVRRAGVR